MDRPLEWTEADSLPDECRQCYEGECYNCDYAENRWYLSEEDDRRLRRKGLIHTINRLERRLEMIGDSEPEIRQKTETDLAWYKQVFSEDFDKTK